MADPVDCFGDIITPGAILASDDDAVLVRVLSWSWSEHRECFLAKFRVLKGKQEEVDLDTHPECTRWRIVEESHAS